MTESPIVPLVPRELFFGNPEYVQARISPDGTRISYLAPEDGVLNVWLQALGSNVMNVITRDRGRGIHLHYWAFDNRHILYRQDQRGDENWHIYAFDVTTREVRDLTPFENIQAGIDSINPAYPGEILGQFNQRDSQLRDV